MSLEGEIVKCFLTGRLGLTKMIMVSIDLSVVKYRDIIGKLEGG